MSGPLANAAASAGSAVSSGVPEPVTSEASIPTGRDDSTSAHGALLEPGQALTADELPAAPVCFPERDLHFMKLAQAAAEEARAAGEVPVGAVLVRGDEVIAKGFNHPIGAHDPSAHAEMVALRAAAQALENYRLPGCELYVTLEPCLMCAGALYWSKISRVVFGADDEKNGYRRGLRPESFPGANIQPAATGPWPFHPKTILTGGILREECARLMQEFFQSKR